MTDLLLSPDQMSALRTTLREASYTPQGVADRLGEAASGALGRGELFAVRHELRERGGDDGLGTLIALFRTGATVSEKAADLAFGAFGLAGAISTGLVEKVGDGVRAVLDLSPYGDDDGDWWVLSDLGSDVRPGPVRSDHVLGIGGASVTLARSTVRTRLGSALDLGTGCGVQALHLSRHVDAVTVTDLSERAIRFAMTNAALNGFTWEARAGPPSGSTGSPTTAVAQPSSATLRVVKPGTKPS